jgi:hypothetical protein
LSHNGSTDPTHAIRTAPTLCSVPAAPCLIADSPFRPLSEVWIRHVCEGAIGRGTRPVSKRDSVDWLFCSTFQTNLLLTCKLKSYDEQDENHIVLQIVCITSYRECYGRRALHRRRPPGDVPPLTTSGIISEQPRSILISRPMTVGEPGGPVLRVQCPEQSVCSHIHVRVGPDL